MESEARPECKMCPSRFTCLNFESDEGVNDQLPRNNQYVRTTDCANFGHNDVE